VSDLLVVPTAFDAPAARRLTTAGFTPVAAYGHHREDPRLRCFALDL